MIFPIVAALTLTIALIVFFGPLGALLGLARWGSWRWVRREVAPDPVPYWWRQERYR